MIEHIVDLLALAVSVLMLISCVKLVQIIATNMESKKHLAGLRLEDLPASGRADLPKVSVIVPARNEEEDIGHCLRSLQGQDYPDYEVIVIDDDSEDTTYDIARSFAKSDPRIRIRHTKKPDDWMGKTWACAEAAEMATGEIFLFTDADAKYDPSTISRTVSYMESESVDCLTLTQKLDVPNIWTMAAYPVITSFKLIHPEGIVLFSAKYVNDSNHRMGTTYGAYIMIRRDAYRSIGGFRSVRNELFEDWVIGRKVKDAGHRLRMLDGSGLVSAKWARDLPTLNNIFRRLMVQFTNRDRLKAIGAYAVLMLLLFAPYPLAAFSLAASLSAPGIFPYLALLASGLAVALHMASYYLQSTVFGLTWKNLLLAPLGGFMACWGLMSGLLSRQTKWRGRTISEQDVSHEG